jgi:hypothetical protein
MGSQMRALRLCIALAALTAAHARAAEVIGVLAVAPPPGPAPELVEVTVQLGQLVAGREGGVLDPRQLRERMTGPTGAATPAELDRALEAARAAYLNGDYDGSIRRMRSIVDDLSKLPEGTGWFEPWTRAMLRLARTEQHLGRAGDAEDTIDRLVRAAPDVEVDPALHPPRLVQRVEAARARLRSAPRCSLSVAASGEGAHVYVSGRDVGVAPVKLELACGRYPVSVVRGQARLQAGPVELDEATQELFFDLELAEALRPALGPGLVVAPEDRPRRIIAAAGRLGLDAVLAVGLAEDAGATLVVGELYDVRLGQLRREARVRLVNGSVPVGGLGALAEFLTTGQTASTLIELPGRPRRVAPPEVAKGPAPLDLRLPPAAEQQPGPSRAQGWFALGAAATAVGLAALAAVETRSAAGSYDQARELRARGNLSTADIIRYNGWVTEGDSAARSATGLWVGAGACALTAGIVGYLQYRRTGELGPFRF